MEKSIESIAGSNNGDVLELDRHRELSGGRLIGSVQSSRGAHTAPPVVGLSDIASIKALFLAWRKFSTGKKQRKDVIAFRAHLRRNIHELSEQLLSGAYQHGPYQPFTIFDPKQRSIHKASVRDRLVHQAFVAAVEPHFERRFIYDSYSCRLNKGSHNGVKRLQSFLQRASRNNTRTVYTLKCDVKKFFDSVDHTTMLSLITRRVNEPSVTALAQKVLQSFARAPGKGLPLGNVTSQLFANVYLHELDFYIKHHLKERWYVRYCDDFVIVHPSKQHLTALIPVIQDFLSEHLQLQLHPNKIQIRTYHQGVDFLGYVIKPSAILLRRRTRDRLLKKVSSKNVHSYLGVCTHASTYQLTQVLKTKAWLPE